ncbi:MAG TPA: retroviral-like aspartic protease family protein [Anaerolineae bacterium]|nr:retroviral-like aspartic protease family protein [Anaerolineae bacterium]
MRFSYDTNYFPPAPSVEISLGIPNESLAVGPLRAVVDTGADVLLVPLRYIGPLGAQIDNRKTLRSQWGEPRKVDVYVLDVGIGDLRFPVIEVIADEVGDEIVLGRNVLNKLTLTLHGPLQVLEILG